jgi:superfamily II DNA or RNA helicase
MDDEIVKNNRMNKYGLKKLFLKTEYNTDDDDIIQDFYKPCFLESIKYDRAVGFFRANIYKELGIHLLNFVRNYGKVRLVCSPDLSEADENYAREGYYLRGKRMEEEIEISLIKIFEAMSKNPLEKDCLEMLRLLIEKDSLDLYIAIRKGGIYHRKIGMFTDKFSNKVIFSGSGNETLPGIGAIEDWSNDEDFDIYRNWGDDFEIKKAKTKEEHLIKLFSGGSGKTKTRLLSDTEKEYLSKFRKYNSFEDCIDEIEKRDKKIVNEGAGKLEIKTDKKLYPYQIDAIECWKKSNYNGIISMPTGTGKTLTALFALQESLFKGYPILIVVPTNILLDQWNKVIIDLYPNIPILLAGGNSNWRENPNKRMFIMDIKKPRIILSTMSTASTNRFLDFISQGQNIILIADEVHRLGSPVYSKLLKLHFFRKLGLSATPMRLFDPEGSQLLNESFGYEPIYNLKIDSKVKIFKNGKEIMVPILGHFLSKYNYYYYNIDFTGEEKEEWDRITNSIRKLSAINRNKDDNLIKGKYSERLKMLLINRSRIAKKAENKINIIVEIIKERYKENKKWIVYCEDEEQLNQVSSLLKKNFNYYIILNYYSKMSQDEKDRVKSTFENNPSLIVSIRCLDEGVDFPDADGAVILASSTNPRQYIQRRGRVLRKALNKKEATIIDVLVLPQSDESGLPYSIIKTELARAWAFSKNALNQTITHDLWKLCMDYNVDTNYDSIIGTEEGDDFSIEE